MRTVVTALALVALALGVGGVPRASGQQSGSGVDGGHSGSAERGKALFQSKACAACHRIDGLAFTGPPLNGIMGTKVLLRDGLVVTVDDAYLRESMTDPSLKVVAGFDQPMPPLQLSDADIDDLVAYLHEIGTPRQPSTPPREFVARGKWLFDTWRCGSCHGMGGRGGVSDVNSANGTVPSLNDLAEKMQLETAEEGKEAIALLEKGPIAAPRGKPPFPSYPRFAAQYHAVHNKILEGARPAVEYPRGPIPPLRMPAWKPVLSNRDVDALIAYLITLEPWTE